MLPQVQRQARTSEEAKFWVTELWRHCVEMSMWHMRTAAVASVKGLHRILHHAIRACPGSTSFLRVYTQSKPASSELRSKVRG